MVFSRLNLVHKSLLIFFFFLIFELGFVSALMMLQQRTEAQLASERIARNVLEHVKKVDRLILSGWSVTEKGFAVHDFAGIQETLSTQLGLVMDEINQLKELVKDRPASMASLDKLHNLLNLATEYGMQAFMSTQQKEFRASEKQVAAMWSVFDQCDKILESIAEDYTKMVDTAALAQSQLRTQTSFVLGTGIFLNLGIGILLLVWFIRDIRGRLAILSENSSRLARGQSLHAAIGGGDEIAHVDASFHTMANLLLDARRRETAVLSNTLDVICSIDARGTFSNINPACASLWGYSQEELLGQRYISLLEESCRDETVKKIREVIETKGAATFEARTLRKDATVVDVSWSAKWAPEENSLFCAVHDITARKEIERVKQEFVGIVSHDLRSPLSNIGASVELLLAGRRGDLPEAAAKELSGIDRGITRLIRLINDLLDIQKLESGKWQMSQRPAKISQLIDRAVAAVETLALNKDVRVEAKASALTAQADSERIVQVLVNLLSNAIEHSSHGSSVGVEAGEVPEGIRITISDRGPGISPDERSRIFEKFEQAKDKKKGTGLGLAICKSIVEAHGGTIGVECPADGGSIFWFTLPGTAKG